MPAPPNVAEVEGAVVEPERGPNVRVALPGPRPPRLTAEPERTGHAEVHDEIERGLIAIEPGDEVLPTPVHGRDAHSADPVESAEASLGVGVRRKDASAGQPWLQLATNAFDFGKLWHGDSYSG
jgi:hypothetical protein